MKTKQEIVENWLPRYTGLQLNEFGQYIILTNFKNYIENFSRIMDVPVRGLDNPMQSATKDNITIINFSMGSPMAATIMDLLTAIMPKAVLFLGKTGSLKSYIGKGELLLPIAAIRGEGTANDYFRPKCRRCPPSTCRRQFRPPSASTAAITGRAPSIPPTAACGSMTRNSRITCRAFAPQPWIWKPPHSSQWASITKSLQAPCCSSPTSLCWKRASRPRSRTNRLPPPMRKNICVSASTR